MEERKNLGEASRELLQLAAGGAQAQEIVEAAYAYARKPIAFVDELYRVMAFYAPGIPEKDCERKKDSDPAERRAWHRKVEGSDDPTIDESGGGPYRAMCLDVRYNGVPVGRLAMMETKPFTPEDAELMKVLSGVLALQTAGSRGEMVSSRDRERSALLRAIIQGETLKMSLPDMLEYLSIPDGNRMRMLVFRKKEGEFQDRRQAGMALLRLFDAVLTEIDGDLVLLTGEEEYAASADRIREVIREYGLVCGAGRPFEGISGARARFRQARGAMMAAVRRGEALLEYERCMAEDVIALCGADRDVMTFVRPEILKLSEYDREHHTDYLATLACYLESLCSMAETSRKTFLHYNTIKYRLRVIEEICGIGAISGEDLCEYLFSVRILAMQPKAP